MNPRLLCPSLLLLMLAGCAGVDGSWLAMISALLLMLSACSRPATNLQTSDAGSSDAGLGDAGVADAGWSDAGSADAGPQDAGTGTDGGVCSAFVSGCVPTTEEFCDAGFIDSKVVGCPTDVQNSMCGVSEFTDCGSGRCVAIGFECPVEDGGCYDTIAFDYCDAGFITSGTIDVACSPCVVDCTSPGEAYLDCGQGTCVGWNESCPNDAGGCLTMNCVYCDAGFIDSSTVASCDGSSPDCHSPSYTGCGDGSCTFDTCPSPDAGPADAGPLDAGPNDAGAICPVQVEYCDAGFIDMATCDMPCICQNCLCLPGGSMWSDCGDGTCVDDGSVCPTDAGP